MSNIISPDMPMLKYYVVSSPEGTRISRRGFTRVQAVLIRAGYGLSKASRTIFLWRRLRIFDGRLEGNGQSCGKMSSSRHRSCRES